jgi:hypothetical protein
MKKKRLLTDRSGELQEQILAEKAKELADETDAQVLRQMLIDLGWQQVVLSAMSWEESYTIDLWVEDNIKGRMWSRGLVWLFEDDRDAMWFKLKWLS